MGVKISNEIGFTFKPDPVFNSFIRRVKDELGHPPQRTIELMFEIITDPQMENEHDQEFKTFWFFVHHWRDAERKRREQSVKREMEGLEGLWPEETGQ